MPSALSSRETSRYSFLSYSSMGWMRVLIRADSSQRGAFSPFQRGSGLRPASTQRGTATAVRGSPGMTHIVAEDSGSSGFFPTITTAADVSGRLMVWRA